MIDNYQPTIKALYHNDDPLPTYEYSSDLGGYLYSHFINIDNYDNIQLRRSEYKRGYPCDMFEDDDGNDITVYFDWEQNVVWWWSEHSGTIHIKNDSTGAVQWFMSGLISWNGAYCSYADFSNWYIDEKFTDVDFDYQIGAINLTNADVSDLDGDFILNNFPIGFNTLHFTGGDISVSTTESSIDLSGMDNSQVNSWYITINLDNNIDDLYIDASGMTCKDLIEVINSSNNDLVVHYNCTNMHVVNDDGVNPIMFHSNKCNINVTDMSFTNNSFANSMFYSTDIVDFTDNTVGNHTGIAGLKNTANMFANATGVTGTMVTKLLSGATGIVDARDMFNRTTFDDMTNMSLSPMDNCTSFANMFDNAAVAGSDTIDFTFLDNWDGHFASGASFYRMFYNPNRTVIYPNWNGTFDADGTFTPNV